MRVLVRKALRDIAGSKLRSLSIIGAIALSVALGIGLVNATEDALVSFDKRLEVTNYQDVDIHFDTSEVNLTEIEAIDGVEKATGRIFLKTQVRIDGERYKAHWIAAPYHPEEPYSEINGYEIYEGSYLAGPQAREAMIGHNFAEANDVGAGEEIEILYENRTFALTVSGIVTSPEYIYVVSDAGWPEPSRLLPLFTTYELAAGTLSLNNGTDVADATAATRVGTFNELLLTVEEGNDKEGVKRAVEDYLREEGTTITRSLLGEDEPDYEFSRTDAGAMGQMGWVFGIIILSITAVVIYNSLSRMIASQRAYIGVMGALGGRPVKIVLHYTMFGLFLGIAGVIVGIPLGIGFSAVTVWGYADVIGLLSPVYTVYWRFPLIFGGAGIAISTLGAFLGALKTVRIGPREALTSNYQAADFSKKPLLERALDRLMFKERILPRLPLRGVAGNKVRTLVSILALAFSLVLVFSCVALFMSFTQPLERNYEKYERWDLKATFTTPLPKDGAIEELESVKAQGMYGEVALDEYLPVKTRNGLEFVHIQAYQRNSSLRSYHVIEGQEDMDRGVLIGSILADELGLGVGDTIEFVLPNRTVRENITGITGELMDDSVLTTLERTGNILGAAPEVNDTVVNAVILKLNGRDRDEVEAFLRENYPVASLVYSDDVIKGMESMMEGLLAFFMIFIVFGVVAEILFISTTVILAILDKEATFISLRALGAKPGEVRGLVVGEVLFLLGGELIVGLPLSAYVTKWAMEYITQDLMYYYIDIPAAVYLITGAIALIAGVLAAWVSARHLTEVKVAEAIRKKFSS